MSSNFAFLHEKFSELEQLGRMAERYWQSDPHACVLKLGLLCEGMVRIMLAMNDGSITVPADAGAAERLGILQRRGLLKEDVAAAFHVLRKVRNKAAHEGYAPLPEQTLSLLQTAHSLCEWFFLSYGEEDYRHQDFVTPEAAAPAASATEQSDEQLVEQAAARAAAGPKMPEGERRARVQNAAGRRHISEAETRLRIDEQLRRTGWEADTGTLRYSRGVRPAAGRNMAIAEWPTLSADGKPGFADYALFAGLKLIGVIEAKARHKDIPAVLDHQCRDYARDIRDEDSAYIMDCCRAPYRVPFVFATNGRPYLEQWKEKSGIWFQDLRRACEPPRALRGWMSPDGMRELLERDTEEANQRLAALPGDMLTDRDGLNLRPYQVRAIEAAERAVVGGAQRVLLALATGTGKTRLVIGLIYRFLKTGRFRRVLFLVDRTALGVQAQNAFRDIRLEELHSLNEIYNVKELDGKSIDRETRVHVATVQGMMRRILYPADDAAMPAVTDYDLVIVDEAHRGYVFDRDMTELEDLYRDQRDFQSKYREVIEYFDAVRIGLTATPALHTTRLFGEPVFRYSYREAVIDGYLVDHDAPHQIGTRLAAEGIHYKAGETVATYDPVTGEVNNAALLEDELDFEIDDFNRSVVNENFNRVVLEEIAGDIDPEEPAEGKTLIYAVNDQHADMIVRLLKEIYAEQLVDGDAIMKITGSVGGGNRKKVQDAITRFQNERFPSIAVTVDLLTTGIDVPEITRLVFLRRVRSRILFEQMLGRATRLCPDISKTHFEIYDAVGVYDALEPVSSMKPVAVNPSATFEQLLDGLEALTDKGRIAQQITQIVVRLQRRKRTMSAELLGHFADMAGATPDALAAEVEDLTPEKARERLLSLRELFRFIQEAGAEGSPRPVVISDRPDELLHHTRGYGRDNQRPEDYLAAFSEFVKTHRATLAALEIVCSRPADLTRESLKSLRLALEREGFTVRQLNEAVSHTSNTTITADIIGLIRRYAVNAPLLNHEDRVHRAVERLKHAHDFSAKELKWLDRIEKYLIKESVLTPQTFDESPLFRDKGGFGAFDKVFGNRLAGLVAELNGYLYDEGSMAA